MGGADPVAHCGGAHPRLPHPPRTARDAPGGGGRSARRTGGPMASRAPCARPLRQHQPALGRPADTLEPRPGQRSPRPAVVAPDRDAQCLRRPGSGPAGQRGPLVAGGSRPQAARAARVEGRRAARHRQRRDHPHRLLCPARGNRRHGDGHGGPAAADRCTRAGGRGLPPPVPGGARPAAQGLARAHPQRPHPARAPGGPDHRQRPPRRARADLDTRPADDPGAAGRGPIGQPGRGP